MFIKTSFRLLLPVLITARRKGILCQNYEEKIPGDAVCVNQLILAEEEETPCSCILYCNETIVRKAKMDGSARIENKLQNISKHLDEVKDLLSSDPSGSSLLESCRDVAKSGKANGNGVYFIRDSHKIEYPVYCDMETDDGGWTIVASVHENNIKTTLGRCSTGDRWSSEHGNKPGSQIGAEAWSNYQIFGNVLSATSDDYKNQAYFSLNATDIMIWHVPNDTPLHKYSNDSYLKYRTTNGFLSSYKGNLKYLYQEFFPIKSGLYKPGEDSGPAIPVVFDKGSAIDLFDLFADNLKPVVDMGYIQFRALNNEQSSFALCPGAKAKTDFFDVEHLCIGSTGDNARLKYCGDFSSFVVNDYGSGKEWNVKLKLIESTYLIFYR